MGAMPWVFLGLSGALLAGTLAALWQSLRAAFGVASTDQARGVTESEERASLLDEKAALLRSLRDLELDHDSGKISDADFERLEGQLRNRARHVLTMLDEEVRAHRPRARALVEEALAAEGLRAAPAAPEPEGEGSPAEAGATEKAGSDVVGRPCPDCGTRNDDDAVFCKKCGSRVGDAGAPEASS
ncbi:MAG: zinc ribbon domain-containing protein [Myxococcota bacterium]